MTLDWNQIAEFLMSDYMILVYEGVCCFLLILFLLKFSRKYKRLKAQIESDTEQEKKTKLNDLLINRSKSEL